MCIPFIFSLKIRKNEFFRQILSGLGKLSINAFHMHRAHVVTISNVKITLRTHFRMILAQFKAKKVGVFSLFFNIFIFTSLAINYSLKVWHQSRCNSSQQSVYSFHRKNHRNPTKTIGSVMILLLGDQQGQNISIYKSDLFCWFCTDITMLRVETLNEGWRPGWSIYKLG